MTKPDYSLGSDEAEIARLQRQAAWLAEPTAMLLQRGGVAPGMRVLDLGTGPGDVAFQVAEIVGPGGSVVGVDQDETQLAVADERRRRLGLNNTEFRNSDARSFVDDEPFDAIVCRLLLFHLPDAADVIAHHVRALRPDGRFVAVDFDLGGMRAVPPVQLYAQVTEWLLKAFQYAHADPYVGMRLPVLLRSAGLQDVESLGLQVFWHSSHPTAPELVVSVVRALASTVVACGAATEDELGLATLERRLGESFKHADAVWTSPTVVGAWGRRA